MNSFGPWFGDVSFLLSGLFIFRIAVGFIKDYFQQMFFPAPPSFFILAKVPA